MLGTQLPKAIPKFAEDVINLVPMISLCKVQKDGQQDSELYVWRSFVKFGDIHWVRMTGHKITSPFDSSVRSMKLQIENFCQCT